MPQDQDTGGFFVAVFAKKQSTCSLPLPLSQPRPLVDKPTPSMDSTNLQIIKKAGKRRSAAASLFDPAAQEMSVKALRSLGYNPKSVQPAAVAKERRGEKGLCGLHGTYFVLKKQSEEDEDHHHLIQPFWESSGIDREKIHFPRGVEDDKECSQKPVMVR